MYNTNILIVAVHVFLLVMSVNTIERLIDEWNCHKFLVANVICSMHFIFMTVILKRCCALCSQ